VVGYKRAAAATSDVQDSANHFLPSKANFWGPTGPKSSANKIVTGAVGWTPPRSLSVEHS